METIKTKQTAGNFFFFYSSPMDIKKQHFVLVHGACLGAWCWYKLETLLTAAGHKVTSLDMAASGTDPRQVADLTSVSDYFEPLMTFMESVSADERVILVGHSFNGFAISLAMEKFTEKISVAVFATATMLPPLPCLANLLRQVYDSVVAILTEGGGISKLDDDFQNDNVILYDGELNWPKSITFGTKFMAAKMYQCCSPEEVTLAAKCVRPFRLFSIINMLEVIQLSEARYGSVRRAFVKTGEDKMDKLWLQDMMILNFPPELVKTIEGADHMVMVSKPNELYASLIEIAQSLG